MFDELIEEINLTAIEFIKKYISKNILTLSKTEQMKFVMQADFYKELMKNKDIKKGFDSINKKFKNALSELVETASTLDIPKVSKLMIDNLALVYEIDATWLLGSAQSYADMLRSILVKGIVAGLNDAELLKQVESITLFDYQKRVMLNQSFTNYRNLILEKLFGNNKEIRYRYAGVLDEKTRDVCRNALENQRPEGYTIDEVQAGALEGIDWYNLGGFNCRHYWEIVV